MPLVREHNVRITFREHNNVILITILFEVDWSEKVMHLSAIDNSLEGWTYNLIRWGGTGNETLDLSPLSFDSILNRITGDDGRT